MSIVGSLLQDERVLLGLAAVSTAVAVKVLSKGKPKLPPGPTVWPVIGTTYVMTNDLSFHKDLVKKYGDIYYIQMGLFGNGGTVVLNTMDLIREAFIHKQDDFAGRFHMSTMDKISLGSSNVIFGGFTPIWRYQRKVMHAALRKYASGRPFQELLEKCVGIVSDVFVKANGQPVDIKDSVSLIFYNIIASVCFGKNYSLDDPEFLKIHGMVEEFHKNFTSPALGDVLPIFEDIPTSFTRQLKRDMGYFFGFLRGILDDHRENFDKNNLRDLADYLIQLNDEMKDNEDGPIKMEDKHFLTIFSDMFLAGTDTSRFALMWMIFFMAAFPDKQKKAQEEIDTKLGRNAAITTTTRINIPYCEAILYETLRLRSPAPMAVPHGTTCDTSVGGYHLPKGMLVVANLTYIHNNPKYWDSPSEFRPERFIDEEGNLAPKPENFLPFSTGRRQCVGEAFAKSELHVVIGMLLQRFTFEPAPGEKVNLDAFPSHASVSPYGFKLVIKER